MSAISIYSLQPCGFQEVYKKQTSRRIFETEFDTVNSEINIYSRNSFSTGLPSYDKILSFVTATKGHFKLTVDIDFINEKMLRKLNELTFYLESQLSNGLEPSIVIKASKAAEIPFHLYQLKSTTFFPVNIVQI